MVAQERHGRIEAEERLKATEDNLAAAEAAMRDMQLHLQSMPAGPSSTPPGAPPQVQRRYLSSHLPYTEYSTFLAHLRSLRPLKETSKQIFPPPLISALLTQAFLARTVLEDHDPTIRLDIAPDLSWLSRRGISSAIISGDLVIEPVSANTVLSQTTTASHDLGCALCGKPVFPLSIPQSPAMSHFGPPPMHPSQRNASSSRFSLKPFFNASPSAQSPTQAQAQSPAASPGPIPTLPSVYIFRVARSTSATTTAEKEKDAKSYPLCRTGWCLERLRATCELWHFLRTGIVHVVWHGDDGFVLPAESAPHTSASAVSAPIEATSSEATASSSATDLPPELPRRKSGWGLGFRMSDKPASGSGWTKAFRGSVNSPPVSPKLPPPGEEKVEKPMSVPGEKEGALGAPLELDSEKAGETDPPSSEAKTSMSPDSAEETFSTPKQVETALPVPEAEPKSEPTAEETKMDGPTEGKDVMLNSPAINADSRSASPAPPPIPRRAAARNRTSIVVEGPSNQASPSASGTATPIISELPEQHPEPDQTSETAPVEVTAPPLPARHPKTPTMPLHVKTGPIEGEQAYLSEDDDSWEARTWRQVLKLKEEMWRKRLGISEGA